MAPFAKDLSVSSDYFETLRIPLLRGRTFTDHDRRGSPAVVIISEALVRQNFPHEDPIGKHIRFTDSLQESREIVGIVGDVRQGGPGSPFAVHAYLPCYQTGEGSLLYIRAISTDESSVRGRLRATLGSVDKQVAWGNVTLLEDAIYDKLSDRRFVTIVIGVFAGLALSLAVAGIYGMIAYSVTQRTREFGIRMALGSTRQKLIILVLLETARLVFWGLLLGMIAAASFTRLFSSLVFGIAGLDPITCGVVCFTLIAVSLSASYIPAYRATRMDPMAALRYQ